MGKDRELPTVDATEIAGGPLGLAVFDGGTTSFVELRPRLVIGRGEGCDVLLRDASVSRRHAVVFGTDPPVIEDAGSRSGTFVGGRRLAEGERVRVGAGDVVRIGPATLALVSRAGKERAATSDRYVVESPRMREFLGVVRLAGRSALSILVEGESGSGKELVAESIHEASGRAGRLVIVNCAALAETLLEAELFGYEKGAFTGASTSKPGLIEHADRGTLFLDEVADMSPGMQSKLLRVLENGLVTRLGTVESRKVDVRFVAATHKSIARLVEQGAFRQDLLYRLAGISLTVPPLRERPEDILPLARHFLAGGSFTADAEAWLTTHPWPGNVRELRAAVQRAKVFAADGGPIDVSAFQVGASLAGASPRAATTGAPTKPTDERARIEAALAESGHNQARAAEILGMSRRTLVRRLAELSIKRPRDAR